MARYACPYCGAEDSTRCDKNITDEHTAQKRIDEARKVGCRVVHYIDLKAAS